jgi:GTPase
LIEYSQEKTRVLLFAVQLKSEKLEDTQESLNEMEALARTLDFKIVERDYQTRERIDSRSYLGTGKLNSIKDYVQEHRVNLVLFDRELSPNQGKYLETFLDCMIWDRTQLILEIFAGHARTPESKDQVELAQLKYMLPRLVGLWAHLDREKGGISASRGTGEKQISIDRRLIDKSITRLEKSLKKVAKERETQAKQREFCFQLGFVGYTNAGKTSLINRLTGAELPEEDKLFATLESATRVLPSKIKPDILISDTVGFIRNLPHNLVASFRSTLSVVKNADLLLHVVDASHPKIEQHLETTEKVLKEIGANRIPRILVLNKTDLITDQMDVLILKKSYPDCVLVSANDSELVADLKKRIEAYFQKGFTRDSLLLPYDKANLLSKLYQLGTVEAVEYAEDGIHITHAMTRTNKKILSSLLER